MEQLDAKRDSSLDYPPVLSVIVGVELGTLSLRFFIDIEIWKFVAFALLVKGSSTASFTRSRNDERLPDEPKRTLNISFAKI